MNHNSILDQIHVHIEIIVEILQMAEFCQM